MDIFAQVLALMLIFYGFYQILIAKHITKLKYLTYTKGLIMIIFGILLFFLN